MPSHFVALSDLHLEYDDSVLRQKKTQLSTAP